MPTMNPLLRGFTLVEMVIYLGLFGALMSGIIVSILPLFQGTEKMSRDVLRESEIAFVEEKLRIALGVVMNNPESSILLPMPGATAEKLVFERHGSELLRVEVVDVSPYCTPPRLCGVLALSENGASLEPLTSSRLFIDSFEARYIPSGVESNQYVDVSFRVDGMHIGPLRYYAHFK